MEEELEGLKDKEGELGRKREGGKREREREERETDTQEAERSFSFSGTFSTYPK